MNYRKEVDTALHNVDFKKNNYQVELETTFGTILLDLWPDIAPEHCKNIIGLTRIGFYNDITIHRVIANFIIQMGCPDGTGSGHSGYVIDQEFGYQLHEVGTLSMARADGNVNSASSQFFICLNTAPHLDYQYTVFGKVANQESLNVATRIGRVETNALGRPLEDVRVNSIRILSHAVNHFEPL